MKKYLRLVMTAFMFTLLIGLLSSSQMAYAAENETSKKAILVVSFGTTYPETRKSAIESVEKKIQAAFPDYEVRRAFTSRIIIKRISEREGLKIDTEKQALEKLKAEGYQEVIIQPLHMEAGDEFEKVRRVVDMYAQNKSFAKISIGRPLLYYMGQEEKPDDYFAAIDAVKSQIPKLDRNEAVVFMGHGGTHPANAAYGVLQMKFEDAGLKNVFVFTVDGYPTFDTILKKLKEQKIKKVTLMPMMLVAGDHANNDMAGNEPDSAKTRLINAGFKVETNIRGLGENPMVQNIYVQHVKDAISNNYTERGKDRPPIPAID